MYASRPHRPAALLWGIVALLAAGIARSDIYGFVDERGITHLSNVPLNYRYVLYRRDPGGTPQAGLSGTVVYIPVPAPRRNVEVDPANRKLFAPLVAAVAREQGLDPALLHAVVTVESGYDPRARSRKGAIGLMQLMPETARRYGVGNIWEPGDNLRGGARYLRDLLARFGDLSLALAAYNAGETAVILNGNRIPPYPETRLYVPRVLHHYHRYRVASG